ncbi:acyltransferase, partial [Escherichia coli]|nr:acyltransferase [Escherichia coli]
DNGYNYDNVLIKGSILSKFSVAPNTPFINVQNYGGTVLINKNWEVDMDLFYKSKTEPFLFIRM